MTENESTFEKLKGTAKEAAGKMTGKSDTVKEGEHQQKKAQKDQEAERLEEEAAERRAQSAGHKAQERRADD